MTVRRLLPFLLVLASACEPGAGSADIAIFGTIWTGDSLHPLASAIAIRGDTIIAVGDSASIAPLLGRNTRMISTGEGLALPAFSDDHVHFSDGGFQLGFVDLRDAATPAEFVQRIKRYAAALRPGEWILGGMWDHERWRGTPLPRREWIDSVTPNNPVFVQRLDGHMGVANSRALTLAQLTAASPDVPGGTIIRTSDGTPTGLLKDAAMDRVLAVIPPPTDEQADTALARAIRFANARGLAAVSAVSAPWYEVAALRRLRAHGDLTLRVAFYPAIADWKRVADSVAAHGPGDDWIRLAGVKGFVDGSLGSTTALMFDPYLDDSTSRGLMITPEDSLRRWIGAADSAGLQVAVHAVGDRANALLLDIYDSVARAHGARDRRFRIEHAQHLRPAEIPRFAAGGILASMQPYHAADDGRWAQKRIRPALVSGTYAFRSLLDARATLLFGSDWTVAPLDPMLGIWAAVTRQTIDDRNPGGWVPREKITVAEAIRAYTASNAFGVFAEGSRGMLRPGYLADVVILDRDIRTIAPDSIRFVTVRMTLVGGRVVYQP
jgi:predicted amidohydrolase YtcJ